MSDRFALQLQTLTANSERALVAADLAARHTEDGRFTANDLNGVFLGLNIPPIASLGPVLGSLRRNGLIVLQPDDRWAITPVGRKQLDELALDGALAITELSPDVPSAEFAHVDHTTIPTWAAPPRWATGIARLLERYPFDSNVLCMTRFPSEGGTSDPVASAINVCREVLSEFGLTLHLASDAIVEEDLFGNVGAYMWACRYGLGMVEDRVDRGLNMNALIELGGMVVTGRRCAVLKDRTAPGLPTDLSGHIYRSVDFDNEGTVSEAVRSWVRDDLGLSLRT